MDQRSDSGYSWSRPQSQPTTRDSRHQAPIQISPYATHGAPPSVPPPPSPATQRPQTYFSGDPFLSRKKDHFGLAVDMKTSKPSLPVGGPFGVQPYATSVPQEVPLPPSTQEQEQRARGTWPRLADGRDDRHSSQMTEGERRPSLHVCVCVSPLLLLFWPRCGHHLPLLGLP